MIKTQGKNCYVNGIIDSKQQQVTRLEVLGGFMCVLQPLMNRIYV